MKSKYKIIIFSIIAFVLIWSVWFFAVNKITLENNKICIANEEGFDIVIRCIYLFENQDENLDHQQCADLFDNNWLAWMNYAEEAQSNGAQWEPPTIADTLAGSEQFKEFRETDCRFTVNDWAYLSEFEDEIWRIQWPDMESFPVVHDSDEIEHEENEN